MNMCLTKTKLVSNSSKLVIWAEVCLFTLHMLTLTNKNYLPQEYKKQRSALDAVLNFDHNMVSHIIISSLTSICF